jgi:hypothetical protein
MRALRALLSGSGSLLALVVVILAVVLPSLGEYEALHALAVGSASSLARALSEIGIVAAGLVVVVPLTAIALRSFSFLPAVSYLLRVRKDMREVHSIYSSWKGGDVSSRDWMASDIAFKLVRSGDGRSTDWTGPDNLTNLASDAWGTDIIPSGVVRCCSASDG